MGKYFNLLFSKGKKFQEPYYEYLIKKRKSRSEQKNSTRHEWQVVNIYENTVSVVAITYIRTHQYVIHSLSRYELPNEVIAFIRWLILDDMVSGFRAVLSPTISILRVVGLNTFSLSTLRKSALWSYYSLLIATYLLAQYLVNAPELIFSFGKQESGLSMVLNLFTSSVTELLAAFFSLFVNWKRRDKNIKILSKLSKIEDKLFLMNMEIRYSKLLWDLRTYIFISAIGLFFIIDLITMILYDRVRLRSVMMLRYSARVISWIDIFYFLMILKIVSLHFKRINKELVTIVEIFAMQLEEKNVVSKMKIICNMHKSLRKICKLHNDTYGLQLSMLTIFVISIITAFMYFLIICNVYYFVFHEDLALSAVYVYNVTWIGLYSLFIYFTLKIVLDAVQEVRELENAQLLMHQCTWWSNYFT